MQNVYIVISIVYNNLVRLNFLSKKYEKVIQKFARKSLSS